ncbi:MAG: phenylacetate--CoA ligase family protein [Actinomycetota bacterium]|nr:phenylacetate--CoA ligase family protein [Actinomycetota bacterium]
MLHKSLFIFAHTLKNKDFMKHYNFVKKNEFESYDNLKRYQEEKLQGLIQFSFDNVPYYHKLFKNLNLKPEDIQSIEDLQKLPILTKEIIRNNQSDFVPLNLKEQKYANRSTAGSTGNPLTYRNSNDDKSLGFAILYANWGFAGYELGDKVAVIAGSSLIPSTGSKLADTVKAFIMNTKNFSAFDLTENYLDNIVIALNKFNPEFLNGYASSLYLFAKHIKEKNLKINFSPKGVFTTAEVLFESQRELIEDVFNCAVFDQYGLNDGGISAYECEKHKGLHVDMIRSITEVTDEEGNQLETGKEGKILATSLHNYAMPFIRYDTGDLGILSGEMCVCGRETPLLEKIIGRVSDFIYTPNGTKIHGEFFSHIFWEFNWVKQFQIIQNRVDEVIVKIVPDSKDKINGRDLDRLKEIIFNRAGDMNIIIEMVNEIETTKAGKWKFIVREVE